VDTTDVTGATVRLDKALERHLVAQNLEDARITRATWLIH